MSKEIVKLSWQEQQDIARQKIREAMNGNTPTVFLAAANNAMEETAEYRNLLEWWSDAFDDACVELSSELGASHALPSAARKHVRETNPEKFARLRELETLREAKNVAHQHLASGSHASIIENNLRFNIDY